MVFCKKKKLCGLLPFLRGAAPPKKSPGSAPATRLWQGMVSNGMLLPCRTTVNNFGFIRYIAGLYYRLFCKRRLWLDVKTSSRANLVLQSSQIESSSADFSTAFETGLTVSKQAVTETSETFFITSYYHQELAFRI